MKKVILIFIILLLIGCKAEKVKPLNSKSNLVELKVSCYPAGFTLIYQVEQWYPLHDTLNVGNWETEFKAQSGELYFISVLSFDESAIITASIYYEGKLIITQTRENYYSSCYVETYLP